jgi:4,5-DOPA dioxygenase extradiol
MSRNEFIQSLTFTSILMTTTKLSALAGIVDALTPSSRMPVLFVGHGNPMNAIEENEYVTGWRNMVSGFEKPKAILCLSAHWETKGNYITAMEKPKTIHDFGGFPQALFDVQYPAPGNPKLAAETQELIRSAEVQSDFFWGLDHGCWSVIKQMYPKADIPVIQLSIDYSKPLRFHFDLAKELSSLRSKGVLIIGSGNMVHNLRRIDWQNEHSGYDWAIEANEGFKSMITNEKYDQLFDVQNVSEAFKLSVPSLEHYIPLLFSLGLKEKSDPLIFFNDALQMGSLSMTSLRIG